MIAAATLPYMLGQNECIARSAAAMQMFYMPKIIEWSFNVNALSLECKDWKYFDEMQNLQRQSAIDHCQFDEHSAQLQNDVERQDVCMILIYP